MSNVEIRAVNEDDCDDLLKVWSCRGVARGTLQTPFLSLDRQKARLRELPEDGHHLVAEVDGRVVGSIILICGKGRRRHTGSIGMGVHDDFQGRGVGTALLEAVLDLADNWLDLKRVELTVYTDNEPAIRLYEKAGFVVEGTHRAYAVRDGELVDSHSMARLRQ